VKGAPLIAANPGPAVHVALLGAIIVIGLIVYAIVRVRRNREAARAEQLSQLDEVTTSAASNEGERSSAER
jgi:hypothetical protein